MIRFVILHTIFLLLAPSAISKPGYGIQFLIDKNQDTIAAVIGTDTIALLWPWEVQRANDMKISFDQCREGSDSLSSIIATLQDIKRKNESMIDRQEGDKKLLLESSTIDAGIIKGLERSLARERRTSTAFKISTGVAILVILAKAIK